MLAFVAPPHFTAPVSVAHVATKGGTPPAVAVNASGGTLVAWTDRGRVLVRRGAAGLARVVSSGPNAGEPSVAIAADGAAAVLWTRRSAHGQRMLEVAVSPASGHFGRPRQLVSGTAHLNSARVLAAGNRFAAVWWQDVGDEDHAVRYALSSHTRFGGVRTLARVVEDTTVSAVASPSGEVVATWPMQVAKDRDVQAAAAVLAPGAERFGQTQIVSADTAQAQRYSSAWADAFAGPGGVALGYAVLDREAPWQLRVATRGPDGRFVPRTVGPVNNDGTGLVTLDGPVVAWPGSGPSVAAWGVTDTANGGSDDPVAGRVDAAVEQPDGTFSTPVTLTPAGEFPTGWLSVAATETAAVVLWPTGPSGRQRLRYVVGTPFGPARTLASGAQHGVTVATAGDRVVAGWRTRDTIRIAELQ